jgi:hypothetical protein
VQSKEEGEPQKGSPQGPGFLSDSFTRSGVVHGAEEIHIISNTAIAAFSGKGRPSPDRSGKSPGEEKSFREPMASADQEVAEAENAGFISKNPPTVITMEIHAERNRYDCTKDRTSP